MPCSLRNSGYNQGKNVGCSKGYIYIFHVLNLVNWMLKLRLGAQSFTLLNTLRDPTQLRRHQWATRQKNPLF